MNIILKYLHWQFIDSPQKTLRIIGNYLSFGVEFFSVKESLKSLFSPWRRQTDSYGKGFDPARWAETAFFNLVARLIGFLMRLFLLIVFSSYEIIVFVAGAAFFLFMLTYPLLAVIAIIWSFKYI